METSIFWVLPPNRQENAVGRSLDFVEYMLRHAPSYTERTVRYLSHKQ